MENKERLVDANAFFDKLKKLAELMRQGKIREIDLNLLIVSTPTVDAVEVVHCKDCTAWAKYPHEEIGDCNSHNCRVGANEFCSRGTRRKHEKVC